MPSLALLLALALNADTETTAPPAPPAPPVVYFTSPAELAVGTYCQVRTHGSAESVYGAVKEVDDRGLLINVLVADTRTAMQSPYGMLGRVPGISRYFKNTAVIRTAAAEPHDVRFEIAEIASVVTGPQVDQVLRDNGVELKAKQDEIVPIVALEDVSDEVEDIDAEMERVITITDYSGPAALAEGTVCKVVLADPVTENGVHYSRALYGAVIEANSKGVRLAPISDERTGKPPLLKGLPFAVKEEMFLVVPRAKEEWINVAEILEIVVSPEVDQMCRGRLKPAKTEADVVPAEDETEVVPAE